MGWPSGDSVPCAGFRLLHNKQTIRIRCVNHQRLYHADELCRSVVHTGPLGVAILDFVMWGPQPERPEEMGVS